jgi:hypothetical protein
MPRAPKFVVDLSEDEKFKDALTLEEIEPEYLEACLTVLRSLRDDALYPGPLFNLQVAKIMARAYATLFKACRSKMDKAEAAEKEALEKAFLWQGEYIVRPDHLYFKASRESAFLLICEDAEKQGQVLSGIPYKEWEPVDDLGLVCAEEINKLIEKKFGQCDCLMCQIKRQLVGSKPDDDSDDDTETED